MNDRTRALIEDLAADLLARYAIGEVTDTERRAIETHLGRSAAARETVRLARELEAEARAAEATSNDAAGASLSYDLEWLAPEMGPWLVLHADAADCAAARAESARTPGAPFLLGTGETERLSGGLLCQDGALWLYLITEDASLAQTCVRCLTLSLPAEGLPAERVNSDATYTLRLLTSPNGAPAGWGVRAKLPEPAALADMPLLLAVSVPHVPTNWSGLYAKGKLTLGGLDGRGTRIGAGVGRGTDTSNAPSASDGALILRHEQAGLRCEVRWCWQQRPETPLVLIATLTDPALVGRPLRFTLTVGEADEARTVEMTHVFAGLEEIWTTMLTPAGSVREGGVVVSLKVTEGDKHGPRN